MADKPKIDRRAFLRATASAASGLLLAFHLPARAQTAETVSKSAKNFAPNAFLNIGADNKITVWVTRSEMGQGVRTALPMMLADELEAEWSQIELKQAVPGAAFKGIRLRTSGTAGVPVSIELTFREGGTLDGCRPIPDVPGTFLIDQGHGTYRVGQQEIRFGPGEAPHRYTQVRGAETRLPGVSVYITGYTPFDRTIALIEQALAGELVSASPA